MQADKTMKARLLAEGPGILAWMVRGCAEWQADGLGLPACVAPATAQYRREEDMVGRFVEERCERHQLAQVPTRDLYSAFRTWCQSEGVEDLPAPRSFALTITQAGYDRNPNRTRYLGIRLTAPVGGDEHWEQ